MNAKLINAVIRQMGEDNFKNYVKDIVEHGIDGGFGGFIYYTDTVSFYEKNKKEILELLREFAQECGYSISETIADFNCLKGYTVIDIENFFINGKDDENYTQIANALAWFAGEEVARHYIENRENIT